MARQARRLAYPAVGGRTPHTGYRCSSLHLPLPPDALVSGVRCMLPDAGPRFPLVRALGPWPALHLTEPHAARSSLISNRYLIS